MKQFGLILIGDELLSGRRTDKHLPKVIEILASRGQTLSWMHCIGDDPAHITKELKWAFQTGDIIFSCGGIGSTPDDHTRQCAAQALDVSLKLHKEARELILERAIEVAKSQGESFDETSIEAQNRFKMGEFPQGAHIIPNAYNKIPGFSCADIHFLPGFPVMAWPMIEWVIDTHYAHQLTSVQHLERSIVVYGQREAALTPLMEEIEQNFSGVHVFSLPSVDHPVHGVHIELGVKGVPSLVDEAFAYMCASLEKIDAKLGPEL